MGSEHLPTSEGQAQADTQQADLQSDDARWQRIARAAFYRAEARGFHPGAELDDWLAAERELDLDARNEAAAAAALPVTEPHGQPNASTLARKRPTAKRGRRSSAAALQARGRAEEQS